MSNFSQILTELEHQSRDDQVRFQQRTYQTRLAERVYSTALDGVNSVIDLPTGAGKTNVAILVSILFKLAGEGRKVLYIVPNRTLIDQAVRAATWAWSAVRRVGLSTKLASNSFDLQAGTKGADLVISTPGLLASLLKRGSLPRNTFFQTIGVTIVDEFDEFLVLEGTRDKLIVRFDHHFGNFFQYANNGPFCLMSATVPGHSNLAGYSTTEAYYAEYIESTFQPTHLTEPKEDYLSYLPSAVIKPTKCLDPYVQCCCEALKYKIESALQDYQCRHSIKFDIEYLFERLREVSSGAIGQVRTDHGKWHPVDDELRKTCRRLLKVFQQFIFLYEDMFHGFSVQGITVPLIVDCKPTGQKREVYILGDSRDDRSHYAAELREKSNAILRIIDKHGNDKGVVFTRFISVSNRLLELLAAKGFGQVWMLDSRIKSEVERGAILKAFENANGMAILLLTRSTGRRGLDIPAADYAILYSPKEEEFVVWQELSRIRSRIGTDKPSYILFYSGTSEEQRLLRLIDDMRESGREYHFEYIEEVEE